MAVLMTGGSFSGSCWGASSSKRHASRPSVWKLKLERISGLEIVELPTSCGKLRMVVDTGSNATTFEIVTERVVTVHLQGLDVRLPVYRTATPVLATFNRAVKPSQRVYGILGGDFFRQFDVLQLDFSHHQLILARWGRTQTREVSLLQRNGQ